MNTRKPRLYVLMTVGLVLALLLGSIPGIKAMAQNVTPAADPIPTFTDVPASHWAYNYIEILYNAGVTTGCSTSPLKYCPNNEVTRAQMAIFLLKAEHGSDYVPPAASGTLFSDVPADYWAVDWIEQLAAEDITTGCAAGMYCPQNGVTRAQMAVFLLKGKNGSDYVPPAASGTLFSDVPAGYWAADWIEQLASEGITTGCGEGIYCPQNVVTRAQMAVFLVKAFDLVDPRGVAPEDFSVMNVSGVVGYNVGFHLVNSTYADVASLVVNLYDGTTLLSTNTATPKFFTDFASDTIQSSPFDVLGTFDYLTDGYWDNSGWAGFTSVIPDKAEIVVTFKNGLVKTTTNTLLTGDTPIFTKGDVVAQDFGVYAVPALNLNGYSLGFGLVDAVASDVDNVVVKVYDGTTVLATATSTGLLANYPTASYLSVPLDVLGSFNYEADGNWSYSAWSGFTSVVPTSAEVTVTFKNGLVKTAIYGVPSGDTSIFTKGDVAPEDFSVMNVSGVIGYNVGFHLIDATYADAESVVVNLYDGTTLLSTNTATPKFFTDFASDTIQSSPFDVLGTFDYVTDGYWDHSAWAGTTSTIPDKAEIIVTFKNGLVKTAVNTNLTGGTAIFAIEYYTGLDFSRTTNPDPTTIGTRSASQVTNPDGTVTISVTSADNEYVDSGIVLNIGTLGDLETITVNGTGDFGLNLYFDLDGNGEFFTWNPDGSFAGVGSDKYALFEGPYGPTEFVDSSSLFGLVGGTPYTNTFEQLKALYPDDTPVGIWIGVTRGGEPAGTKTATINSVTVTTVP